MAMLRQACGGGVGAGRPPCTATGRAERAARRRAGMILGALPIAVVVLAGCALGDGPDEQSQAHLDGEPPPTKPDQPLFDAACVPGERITIAAVGDVLLHAPLQIQALNGELGYAHLWHDAIDLLAGADIAYANLEGAMATGLIWGGGERSDPGYRYDGAVYEGVFVSGKSSFNYHPSLAADLRASGIDIVSTANNHALDRGPVGVDLTIDALEAAELPFTGTRRRDETERPWQTIIERGGLRTAWLSCSYGTNGNPDPDDQVLLCFEDVDRIEALVDALADDDDVDAVIVTPHFGREYQPEPNNEQTAWAHRMLDAGALAVLGSHPHVLQPWERHMTPDGRETFVIYSLGNFVSGQEALSRTSSIILFLELVRDDGGATRVSAVRYVPIFFTVRDHRLLQLEVIDSMPSEGFRMYARDHVVAKYGESLVLDPNVPLAPMLGCAAALEPAGHLDHEIPRHGAGRFE